MLKELIKRLSGNTQSQTDNGQSDAPTAVQATNQATLNDNSTASEPVKDITNSYNISTADISYAPKSEDDALQALKQFENTIAASATPNRNPDGTSNIVEERAEIRRSREALKVKNPFRGV